MNLYSFNYKKFVIFNALAGLLLFGIAFTVTSFVLKGQILLVSSPTPSAFPRQDSSLPNCQTSQMFESVDLALKDSSSVCALRVPNNEFTLFTKNIKSFSTLKELSFVYNNLTELPSNINTLKELRVLNLRSNQLSALSIPLLQSLNLSILNLDDNPLSDETVLAIRQGLPTTVVTFTLRYR